MTNQITIQGIITTDNIELVKNKNQTATNFTIQNSFTSQKTKREKTMNVDCVAFNEVAEYICQNYKYGDEILVFGRLSIGAYFKPEIVLFSCSIKNTKEKNKI